MSSTFLRVAAVILSAGAGVGLGVGLHILRPGLGRILPDWPAAVPNGIPASASASPAPTASAGSSAIPTGASATPPSQGSANPNASASAHANSPDAQSACLRELFAEDSFTTADPGLAKICEDKSPSKASRRVKELVVNASGGRLTGGMKEWAVLGIFELAAISAMRGQCCPGAEPLTVPEPGGSCTKLAESMQAIENAARPGAPVSDLDAAVARFDQDARCIIRAEQVKAFGDYGPLGGGEAATLDKTLQRVHKGAPSK